MFAVFWRFAVRDLPLLNVPLYVVNHLLQATKGIYLDNRHKHAWLIAGNGSNTMISDTLEFFLLLHDICLL